MSAGAMVAALAAVLALATLAAALAAEETLGLAVVTFGLALLAALAIAAAVLAPVIVVRSRQGKQLPGRRLLAAALAFGGLIVLPVYWHFYTEPGLSGPVGRCFGLVPLGELVQTRLAGDEHAAVSYSASCDD